MFIVRESRLEDVDAILAVAEHLDSYNLPYNRKAIEEIVQRSVASFDAGLSLQERAFTFVVEDAKEKQIVGTSMLYAQHGTHSSPHVYLDVLQDEHYSESLDKYLVHQALHIGYNYNGPTEIGGLIVLPEYRGHAQSLGKLLSCSRFLFIAMNRSVFRDQVLSELLPRLEIDGTSRLWKLFGKRFTGLSYQEADKLSKDNKEFIKSLFPQGMVYTSLFPPEVQAEIGVVGPQTKGVERLLTKIGFRYAQQIDPFDGGPHFIAKTDKISLVANAKRVRVAIAADAQSNAGTSAKTVKHLVALPRKKGLGFRCTWSPNPCQDSDLPLPSSVVADLQATANDEAWCVTL